MVRSGGVNYLHSLLEICKTPFWLFVVILGLFMIFYDSKNLRLADKKSSQIIKWIGIIYIFASTVIYITANFVR